MLSEWHNVRFNHVSDLTTKQTLEALDSNFQALNVVKLH